MLNFSTLSCWVKKESLWVGSKKARIKRRLAPFLLDVCSDPSLDKNEYYLKPSFNNIFILHLEQDAASQKSNDVYHQIYVYKTLLTSVPSLERSEDQGAEAGEERLSCT